MKQFLASLAVLAIAQAFVPGDAAQAAAAAVRAAAKANNLPVDEITEVPLTAGAK
jgi:hypothetical protein